jgi:hypothetical protein
MNAELGRSTYFRDAEPVPEGLVSATHLPKVVAPNVIAPPPESDWKSKLLLSLLVVAGIVTILWIGFLCTLMARFVWSLF